MNQAHCRSGFQKLETWAEICFRRLTETIFTWDEFPWSHLCKDVTTHQLVFPNSEICFSHLKKKFIMANAHTNQTKFLVRL